MLNLLSGLEVCGRFVGVPWFCGVLLEFADFRGGILFGFDLDVG